MRKTLIGLAALGLVLAWGGVVATYLISDSLAAFTIAVTIAALATEAAIWVAALVGGWTLFANRRRLWQRLTGRAVAGGVK